MTMRAVVGSALFLPVLLAPAVAPAAEGDQSNTPDIRTQVRTARRDLWRAGIDAPADQSDSVRLREAIRQLREFEKNSARPEPARPAPIGRASVTPKAPPIPAPASQPITRPISAKVRTVRPGGGGISPTTLRQLRKLSPKGVHNAIALGDSLLRGGHLEEAVQIYQVAMQRDPGEEDRAWVMFQMGNCKRTSDPEMAAGFYKRLLSEHPGSLWSGVAEIQEHLIQWRRINDPGKLLKELKADAERRAKRARPQVRPAAASRPSANEAPIKNESNETT